ncbi:MAG TPA: sensor histidine kinase [Puia sp.]|jgi:signal transduction histidine kinase|nr:sensor histidine kinase [Puia sp.]
MEEKSNSLIQGVIIICSIFTLVAGFLVSYVLYFNKRKNRHYQEKKDMEALFSSELLKTQFETREEALTQISEELHDHIGQLLSSTKMLLGITERSIAQPPATLLTAQETLGKAIQDIRGLSKALNREWLDLFNIIDNLQAEAARINAGQSVSVNLEVPSYNLPLDSNTQIILFRIIQETLQNSIKHAGADHIDISISAKDGLTVIVKDDGSGFNVDEALHNGIGLGNIRRRAKAIGGEVNIISAPGEGTSTTIRLHKTQSI